MSVIRKGAYHVAFGIFTGCFTSTYTAMLKGNNAFLYAVHERDIEKNIILCKQEGRGRVPHIHKIQ